MAARKKVVHKEFGVPWGGLACGMPATKLSRWATPYWSRVTCKNCLRHRPKQRK
jgi:hypothetical protein